MLRTTRPKTQHHNHADWNIFYMRFLLAKNIKITQLECDSVQFNRCRCLRRRNRLHLHGQPWYTPSHPSRLQLMPFQPYYQYYLTLALFLLRYLYVCLQSHNTVAWFYLFLHTVLRYFYHHHTSLYIFFNSLNYASSLWTQFIFQFSSKSVTYRNFVGRSWLYFKKMITVNVVTCQDGAVEFSHKILDFPTDLKQTRNSEIMCCLPTGMYGVFDSSGNHSLNGQQFIRNAGQIQSLHYQNLAPWSKTTFDIPPNFFCHFLFHF